MGFYEMVFGDPDQRRLSRANAEGTNVSVEACDDYGGVLGGINGFFCHMEKDMGIRGPGAATKSFAGLVIHAEILKTATTIGSVTYDYQAEVWICNAQVNNCALLTNFNRFDYVAFSYDAAAGVNKGYALSSPNALISAGTGASEIIYDVGSASASQSVAAKLNFTDPNSVTYDMRVLGTKTASAFTMNVVGYDSTHASGFRFAMSGAPPSANGGNNYYNMYFEDASGIGSNGYYSLDVAGVSAPAQANGYCALASEQGSATGIQSATGHCTGYNFAPFDTYSLAGHTPNAQGFTANGILNTWQGMSAHPSAL
jgi:hypothetical protein